MSNQLLIHSSSLDQNGCLLRKHSALDQNISPSFQLENLHEKAVTLAIIFECIDNKKTHWIIWNIPAAQSIDEGIKSGAIVKELNNAFQGVALGKNRYFGPKPRFYSPKKTNYCFTVYALDTQLDLLFSADKTHLLKAMDGHILQTGKLFATFEK